MATSADNHLDASRPAAEGQYREHLRRLRTGLTLTAMAIQSGAAAFRESVKLLNRLDGRAAARGDGNTDGPRF